MEPTLGRALEVVLGRAPPSGPAVEEPGASPTPAATPAEGETPAPTPSPAPTSALPEDVDALICEANAAFERAQQLLRQGDFAGYGEEIARLQDILQRLVELTGEQ